MANMEGEKLADALKTDQAIKEAAQQTTKVKCDESCESGPGAHPKTEDGYHFVTPNNVTKITDAPKPKPAPELDEVTAAVQGKAGAETVAINPASVVVATEQRTALLAKIVTASIVEVARSLLPELMTAIKSEMVPNTAKGVKAVRQVHDLAQMDAIVDTMKQLANVAAQYDLLGDKAQARIDPAIAAQLTGTVTSQPDVKPADPAPAAGATNEVSSSPAPASA